jgi:YbbR domain-containing protein
MITTPDNTTLTSQTVETVVVKVDSPSEESYPITADSVELVGWSLDSGCYFGTPTVSATRVTVYGPTLEIDTIDKVKIRTSNIGKASDKMTVAAEVVLLDKYGDEINSPNLSVTMNADMLTVKLSVYMQKTVPLTVNCKHGYFGSENVSVFPSEVVIVGSPDAVKTVSFINLADIDETKELTDRTFTADILKPAGIEKITTADGEDIANAEVSIKVSEIKEFTISLLPENIVVYSSNSMVALTGAEIKVRLSSSASEDVLSYITPSDIIASVNASSSVEGDSLSLVLTVSENFRGSV